jgi:glycosidase
MSMMMTRQRAARVRVVARATGALALVALAGAAVGETGHDGPMLQWFEASRNTIENRMPDFFVAGYSSVWLPPVSVCRDPNSTGYDPLSRFNLGEPGNETLFGTERDFTAMVEQFHRAGGYVYIDTILNHNAGRDASAGFLNEGGYSGFYLPASGLNFWGDHNNGATQSQDPCAGDYNLFDGDLVGLIDIDISSNFWTIRHPIDDSLPEGVQASEADALLNPRRIPEGTIRNVPDPNNRRFYPDTDLPTDTINNPGYSRFASGNICGSGTLFPASNVPAFSLDIPRFDPDNPMGGDPVPENATANLMRWSRYMLEVHRVDGFRLDAAKHMPQWFWDEFFDTHVHNRWLKPDGSYGTPFSFVEATSGNFDVYNQYCRKDGFANRDALDLSGAGNIRNIIGGKGASFAGDMINGHIDPEDDGFNNGSVGVNHIHSHDNGSTGDGGSAPSVPFEDKVAPWAYAYLMMRTGPAIVYHNAREFHGLGVSRFWPREGVPIALGYGAMQKLPGPVTETAEDDRITTLVQLIFAFTRQGNCVVAMNDTYGTGYDERTFNTTFAPGTRLHELTGNATDPVVDPSNQIFDVITVGSGGSVTVRVPRNGDSAVDEHNSGYVVYGPATPSGTLSLTTTGGGPFSVIPADPPGTPFARRLTPITVIQDAQFKVALQTSQTDALDPNVDDNAMYRINAGFTDLNGNGFPTFNPDGSVNATENSGEFRDYESFVTTFDPLWGGGSGLYEQIIDTDDLPEGMNYISVLAFRHGGGAAGDSLYKEWRQVFYVDRQPATVEITPDLDCLSGNGNIRIVNPDFTVREVHAFVGLDPGDPTPALSPANEAIEIDRNVWLFPVSGLDGTHTIRVVLIEEAGGQFVSSVEQNIEFTVDDVSGDVNDDGVVDARDFYAFEELAGYECRADLDADLSITENDRRLLRDKIGADELDDMLANR